MNESNSSKELYNKQRIINIASKKVITIDELQEIRKWYMKNYRFNWLGSFGIDGTGEIYQLIIDYGLINEKIYEFYLDDEYYKERNCSE